jgi:hypothetical protein
LAAAKRLAQRTAQKPAREDQSGNRGTTPGQQQKARRFQQQFRDLDQSRPALGTGGRQDREGSKRNGDSAGKKDDGATIIQRRLAIVVELFVQVGTGRQDPQGEHHADASRHHEAVKKLNRSAMPQ